VSASPLIRQQHVRQRLIIALVSSLVIVGIASAAVGMAWFVDNQQHLSCTILMSGCNSGQLMDGSEDHAVADSLRNFWIVIVFVIGLWIFFLFPWVRQPLKEDVGSPNQIIRGAIKASEDFINELTATERAKEQGPHILFGKIAFPRRLEQLSLLVTGSPGSGKTTVIQSALGTIHKRSTDKVAIYDRNGDYARKFYSQKRGDVILGLSELASATWNIWNEFPDGYGFQAFVELVIPKEQGTTYWVDNGRIVLLELLKKVNSWKQLRKIISTAPLAQIVGLLEGTPAFVALTGKYGEEIRSGVNSRTTWLDLLQDYELLEEPINGRTTNEFSFHEWAKDDSASWVFIVVPERYRIPFAPILTVYFDLIAQAVMERKVDHTGFKRLWLVCDELSSARYQPRLADYLAEGRKFGACAILGFQLISQIRFIYGPDETETIFGLCQSKLILRTTDGATCKFLADMLGTQDYFEPSLSVSKSDQRRSTSEGYQRRNEYLFLPAEIKDLPQFHGILVMPTLPTSQIVLSREAHSFPNVELPKVKTIPQEEEPVPANGKPSLKVVKYVNPEQVKTQDSQSSSQSHSSKDDPKNGNETDQQPPKRRFKID
jgi:energy-coupling factor transporter ATP-binding protein EcfA2